MKNRKWKYIIIYSILAILLITAIDIIHSSVKNDAKYLTEAAYGPFVYHDEIYVFSDLSTFPSSHDTDVLDYIHSTSTDYFSENYHGVYRMQEESDPGALILNPDFFVGVIFYESGKFYFGNYDNEIVNEAKDALLKAIEN